MLLKAVSILPLKAAIATTEPSAMSPTSSEYSTNIAPDSSFLNFERVDDFRLIGDLKIMISCSVVVSSLSTGRCGPPRAAGACGLSKKWLSRWIEL